MLYPTSNCHEWTSDNGIEHRIMEIEFQHGCEVIGSRWRGFEQTFMYDSVSWSIGGLYIGTREYLFYLGRMCVLCV